MNGPHLFCPPPCDDDAIDDFPGEWQTDAILSAMPVELVELAGSAEDAEKLGRAAAWRSARRRDARAGYAIWCGINLHDPGTRDRYVRAVGRASALLWGALQDGEGVARG